MFFPYADTPNPPGFQAWVTWALIALNVLVYVGITLPLSLAPVDPLDPTLAEWLTVFAPQLLATPEVVDQLRAYDLFTFRHGYKPGAPSVVDLFSSMFLHGGFLHLAGNMLFLWIYGDNAEHRLGRLTFLVAYLGTGAAATLAFAAVAGSSMVPLVGASGAISGVLGMYFLWFPQNRVKVFVAFFPFFFNTMLIPARIVLGIFVVLDNVLPLVAGSGGGVAYGAHLGGFFAGLLVAYAVSRSGFGLGDVGREAVAEVARVRQAPRGEVIGLAQGRLRRAEAELATGRMWLEAGHPVAAWQHLARAAKLDPGGPVGAQARAVMAAIEAARH